MFGIAKIISIFLSFLGSTNKIIHYSLDLGVLYCIIASWRQYLFGRVASDLQPITYLESGHVIEH